MELQRCEKWIVHVYRIFSLARSFSFSLSTVQCSIQSKKDKTNKRDEAKRRENKKSFCRLFAICWRCSLYILAALLHYWSIDKRRFMAVIFVQFILEPYFYLRSPFPTPYTHTLNFSSSFLCRCSSVPSSYEPNVFCGCFWCCYFDPSTHFELYSLCMYVSELWVCVCVSILVCIGRKNQPHCRKCSFFY